MRTGPGWLACFDRATGWAVLFVIAVPLAACSTDPAEPAADDVFFITQNIVPNVVMDALFTGDLVIDEAGCIRLDWVDDATVIWPKGFTLDRSDGVARVRDAGGREVGRIPGPFGLGGGEAAVLHDGIGVSAADRRQATDRCPGRYWITGDIPGLD